MRQALALLFLLFPSLAFSNHVCSNTYGGGWVCDGDIAAHCTYDYYYKDYVTDYEIPCGALVNSWGCFAGSCNCISYCARGIQNRDCSCTCSYPWGGLLCNNCLKSDSECRNGGYMNRQTCQCNCPNTCLHGGTQTSSCDCANCPAPWTGQRCEICTRSSSECGNGGYMDSQTCQCVCPTKCANGGIQDANCRCSCPEPWVGPTCQSCSLTQANCDNGSTLNTNQCKCDCTQNCQHAGTLSRTCDCNCAYPWTSTFCQTCSLSDGHCSNNATFNSGGCFCDCSNAETCKHGGKRMADYSCGCECVNGWGGPDCATCQRDAAFCQRGGNLNASACNCNCNSATACQHGKHNERCQCLCDAGFSGPDCAVASAAAVMWPSVVLFVAVATGVTLLM